METIDLYKLISGQYEPAVSETHVPDFAYSPLNKSGLLYQPVIDKKFMAHGAEKPKWPEGKPFVVCLTHDVDAVSEFDFMQNIRFIKKLAQTSSNRPLGASIRRIVEHKIAILRGLLGQNDQLCDFGKWMDVEEGLGARSTFFFAPQFVRRAHHSDCMYRYDQMIDFRSEKISVSELMKIMDQGGWEIGLHPSWQAHADLDELVFQKDQIESILDHTIQSVRQHFLKYDPLLTPQVQAKAGFNFDSTMGYNDNLGFRRGSSYPFKCVDLSTDEPLPLLQIPLVVQDGAILAPGKGMRLDPRKAIEYIVQLTKEVKRVGGILSLSWHPHTMNRPYYFDVYSQTLELLAKENPWFATVGEVGSWWQEHVNIDLLRFTKDLNKGGD